MKSAHNTQTHARLDSTLHLDLLQLQCEVSKIAQCPILLGVLSRLCRPEERCAGKSTQPLLTRSRGLPECLGSSSPESAQHASQMVQLAAPATLEKMITPPVRPGLAWEVSPGEISLHAWLLAPSPQPFDSDPNHQVDYVLCTQGTQPGRVIATPRARRCEGIEGCSFKSPLNLGLVEHRLQCW